MARSDVLIVGAGPTGLALPLWLTKLGGQDTHHRQDYRTRHDLAHWPYTRARWSYIANSGWLMWWSHAATRSRPLGSGSRARRGRAFHSKKLART